MNGVDKFPEEVLENIAYLTRSRNRVKIFRALVSAPASPRELRERTGTSKTTCNRILNEFAERSWTWKTAGGNYEATPRAKHLAVQFRPFVESMATISALGDDVEVLPIDELAWGPDGELTLGTHHFSDATVKRKRPQQQGVGRAEIADAFRTTSTIHAVSDGSPPRVVGEVLQERATRGELSGIEVFTTELFEHLRDHHDGPPNWADMIESGVETYRYDGATPGNLTVTDESTFVWDRTTEGTHGVVISRNEAVRVWGIDVVERYRDRAERLEPAAFD
jgi:predicted transcriptional regulator